MRWDYIDICIGCYFGMYVPWYCTAFGMAMAHPHLAPGLVVFVFSMMQQTVKMIWNDNELIHCHFMSFHLLFHHGAVIDGLETPRASLLCKAQIINMFTIIWGTGIDHWMHGWQGCGKHQEDNGSRNGISARSQKAFVLRVATSGVHHYASPKTCQLTQEGDPLERWGAVSGCFWQGSTRPSKLKGLKVDKNRERETTQTLHTYSTSGEFWSLSYCCPR